MRDVDAIAILEAADATGDRVQRLAREVLRKRAKHAQQAELVHSECPKGAA